MARINFGYILRKLRHSRDETLEQVSDATGLSVAMLSRIERGERFPSPDSVEALARHFELPVDYLMSETIANRMVNRYGEESTSRAAEHLSRESAELGLLSRDNDEIEEAGQIDEPGATEGLPAPPLSLSRARRRRYGMFEEMDIRAALEERALGRPKPPAEESSPAQVLDLVPAPSAPPARPTAPPTPEPGAEIDPATESVLRAARQASEAAAVLVLREAPALSSRARLELIASITDIAGQAMDVLHILAADPDNRVRGAARNALRRLARG